MLKGLVGKPLLLPGDKEAVIEELGGGFEEGGRFLRKNRDQHEKRQILAFSEVDRSQKKEEGSVRKKVFSPPSLTRLLGGGGLAQATHSSFFSSEKGKLILLKSLVLFRSGDVAS